MNPGPTAPKRNDILWELLPFHNCSFSTERMDYQFDPLSVVSNDAWNIFQKRVMHFIHLNINSIVPKIDEIRYFAKLTNATVIGLSETKLDGTVLNSELEIEVYELTRSDQSGRGGGVACFVSYTLFHIIGNLGDININLQPKDKKIFRHKPANTINIEIPHLTRSYLEFCFTYSFPTKVTDQTATLIYHILTNSPDKFSQSGIIDLGLSDHELIYCKNSINIMRFLFVC